MCGKIDCYIDAFAKLRTDKNRNRWTEATTFRAPHKPLLLLSILDLVAQGRITRNFIEPAFELAETFAGYWQRIMPIGSAGNMAYPFFFMDSEPFWTLVPRPGIWPPAGRTVSSMRRIRELYLGARLDEELFPLLLMEPLREKLRTALVKTYFAPEVRPLLLEQGRINIRWVELKAPLSDVKIYNGKLVEDTGLFEAKKVKKNFFSQAKHGRASLPQDLFQAIVRRLDEKCRTVDPKAYAK